MILDGAAGCTCSYLCLALAGSCYWCGLSRIAAPERMNTVGIRKRKSLTIDHFVLPRAASRSCRSSFQPTSGHGRVNPGQLITEKKGFSLDKGQIIVQIQPKVSYSSTSPTC